MSGHHIVPVRTYASVFAALIILLFATVWVANIDFGNHAINISVALTIAVIKMALIVLFFMHVRWSSKLTMVFAASGFIWLMIMFAFTFSDYLTRAFDTALTDQKPTQAPAIFDESFLR